MSHRNKRAGPLEAEIEKAREEGNWKKVIDLANQLKERPDQQHRQTETLGWFLIGEGKLEEYLEEVPPKEENTKEARTRLKEAKECLERTIGEEAKKLGVHLDSWILLAKLNYAMGNYAESLKFYEKAQIETLEEKHLPTRSLKIMAEAFAIKGNCYEKLPLNTTSQHKILDRKNKIIKCYELAGDLTLLYLQESDRGSRRGHAQSTLSMTSVGTSGGGGTSPVPPAAEHKLGIILESAILKSAQLQLRAGRVDKAVERLRTMLQAEETRSPSNIRLGLARNLAETLLHSVSDDQYTAPDTGGINTESRGMSATRHTMQSVSVSDSPWKPRRYGGSNVFVPNSRHEEVVLLLLLAESMASKHVPLNQTPDFDSHRNATMDTAKGIFNLMTLACATTGHYKVISDMFERSLRFSPKDDHVWSQFALAMACEGRFKRSLVILSEVAQQRPSDSSVCLLAARTCYERLDLLAEGVEWAQRALDTELAHPQDLLSRCHLYLGIGLYLQSHETETRDTRVSLSQAAAKHLLQAAELDPGDHLANFYLGIHYASQRQLNEAHNAAKSALQLQPEHLPSLNLGILTLSARGEDEEALRMCEQALTEYPDNLTLLAVKARLEERIHGGEQALATAKNMLYLLRDMGDGSGSGNGGDSGIGTHLGVDISDSRSVVAANHWDALSDKDSVSLQAHSVAASQVEKTLSEVASSLSVGIPKHGPQDSAYAQIRTWMLTGELYLRLDQIEAAELCANEARQVFPLSYLILYLKGAIHQARDEYEQAKSCYQNALSIYPRHLQSLQSLGQVHLHLGSPRLAEMTLRAAIRLDPNNHISWYNLGCVMETLDNESDTASNCFATAQAMEAVSPVLPFNTIPLAFE